MAKSHTEQAPGTIIVVGPYRIHVNRESFLVWERKIMSAAGFTDGEIKAEILRRLGICAQ